MRRVAVGGEIGRGSGLAAGPQCRVTHKLFVLRDPPAWSSCRFPDPPQAGQGTQSGAPRAGRTKFWRIPGIRPSPHSE